MYANNYKRLENRREDIAGNWRTSKYRQIRDEERYTKSGKKKNKKYGGRKIQDIRGEYQLCWSRMVVEGK